MTSLPFLDAATLMSLLPGRVAQNALEDALRAGLDPAVSPRGSHQAGVRELDERVFARAARVVVEERATALREAGDVIMAVAAGALVAADLMDLIEMLDAPAVPGISVFESVGMGWQDLVLAGAAHAACLAGVPA